MCVLQPISCSLLLAFCYRHLPPPDRRGARPPDHGVGICVRRTRCSPDPCQAAGSVLYWRVSPVARLACTCRRQGSGSVVWLPVLLPGKVGGAWTYSRSGEEWVWVSSASRWPSPP